MTAVEFYRKLTQEEIDKIEAGKMEFCRRMISPKGLMEKKEGHPYGDTNGYYPWEHFPPG